MKNLLVLTLLLIGMHFISYAQTEKIDSLKQAIEVGKRDSAQFDNMIKLTGELRFVDGAAALAVCHDALDLAREIKFEQGEMESYYMMGVAHFVLGQYEEAIEVAESSLALAIKREDQVAKGMCYNLLGVACQEIRDYEKALKYLFESAQLMDEKKDSLGLGTAYNNIGKLYYNKLDSENARKYFGMALDIGLARNDSFNLATYYLNLSDVVEDNSKVPGLLKKALFFAESSNNVMAASFVNNNMGAYFHDKGAYIEAIPYYKEAVSIAETVKDNYSLASGLLNIGDAYTDLNQLDSAQIYLKKGLSVAEAYGFTQEIQDAYEYLSKVYEQKGAYKTALDYFKQYHDLHDTLYNESITTQLAQANTQFETEKKEAEISQQQLEIERRKNTQIQTVLAGIFLLMLASAIFLWYYSRSRAKKRKAELALELKKVESQKLRELDQMKSRFFTNISHELRTPLTLIIEPLKNAVNNVKDERLKPDLTLAQSNSKKLLSLINEILDLSKLVSGKLELQKSEINLYKLTKRVFYSFHSMAEIRQLELEMVYKLNEHSRTFIDVNKYEKILNNLISNAIKYSKNGGLVKLEVKEIDSMIHISVSDTGIGIHAEDLDKVFERYYQVHQDGANLHGGTGVGLALAKELAKLFGGDITVQSELDLGSTFTLAIPLELIEAKETEKETDEEVKEIENSEGNNVYEPIFLNGEKAKILIVEDNPEMSSYLNSILSPFYNCSLANDGLEALKMVQKTSFDLITSDVMMPHMDGFELKERVNSIEKLNRTPFILLTARALEEDKITGLNLGVDDYITKPFSTSELLARIRNLLVNKVERENWMKDNKNVTEVELNGDSVEVQLLKSAESVILKNISEPGFKVKDLAEALNLGERQLRRVLRKATGLSPVNFILELRLQKAYQLLQRRQYLTVSEVRYATGIESASYFTSKFKARFGRNPKELLE